MEKISRVVVDITGHLLFGPSKSTLSILFCVLDGFQVLAWLMFPVGFAQGGTVRSVVGLGPCGLAIS